MLKDKIKQAKDIPSEIVNIPEWDCSILIKGMTAGERGEWNSYTAKYYKSTEEVNFTDKIVIPFLVKTLRDPETEELIFSDSEEDRELLSGKQLEVLMSLFDRAAYLSGIGKAAEKDIEKTF